jgi:hypothetical protein
MMGFGASILLDSGDSIRRLKMIAYLALALSMVSAVLLGGVGMQFMMTINKSVASSSNNTNSVSPVASLPQEFQGPPLPGRVPPTSLLVSEVAQPNGVPLPPVRFGNTVGKLVQASALNASAVRQAMNNSGEQFASYEANILSGNPQTENLVILNSSDSSFILNVLWAIGINNNNAILNSGPVVLKGNPFTYASTAGYAPLGKLSLGGIDLLTLTAEEQVIAEQVAANTYRPCCDNPAAFPDCNHGAAALGLIELMASQGFNSTSIYGALKQFESFYFPQDFVYEALFYFVSQGLTWDQVPGDQALSIHHATLTGKGYVQQYLTEYAVGQPLDWAPNR